MPTYSTEFRITQFTLCYALTFRIFHPAFSNMKAKSLKKPISIKEICSWLPPGLDGRKVCSQEHISSITNSFFNDFAFIFQFKHKGY